MTQTDTVQLSSLTIDSSLFNFINEKVLPLAQLEQNSFWHDFETLLHKFMPVNKELLHKRELIQQQIDQYHQQHPELNFEHYKSFLTEIGYLLPEPGDFTITSDNVDPEIATIAGPQLVVPIMNARFALNAANARWGSLYDALYGTDVISEENGAEKGTGFNPLRGAKVIEYGRQLLNEFLPLKQGTWQEVTGFEVEDGRLRIKTQAYITELANTEQFIGYQGHVLTPSAILLKHNNLHLIIEIDATSAIGKTDLAFIKDIKLEAAITTIMDCEDSVAAVDAEDKCLVYSNWLGLMHGDLQETVAKNGEQFVRRMNPDLEFTSAQGDDITLPGRSLMFVRNVGHLMTNPAILVNGEEIPEGILDGVITSAIGKHDLINAVDNGISNSKTGSIYIVKPKMHGPEEVAFTNNLFDDIEIMLGLAPNTLKMGIMDEERRTSVNLKACVEQAKNRVVFINTGFLDRTGDEIHTSMLAGPFKPKAELKTMPWITAYEQSNVAVGLKTGFLGKAQIGKGMWPIPDQMANMMQAKTAHPKAGASTAWVPSPTAATLHAIHYHQFNVANIQQQLTDSLSTDLDSILTIPLMAKGETLSEQEIINELENNAQGILGYVVRWVDAGVGCSKVPDINNVGLMEDRATCRISSQHIANWLCHGICSEQQVIDVMKKMAVIVDQQNASDPTYTNMAPNFDSSIAFNAALDLVIKGTKQPSGYTEPLLHQSRIAKKRELAQSGIKQSA